MAKLLVRKATKAPKKPQVTGFVVYNGPSAIDGTPIVGIVTLKTTNAKTGNMAQLWILPDNGESPVEASKSLGDSSVCGGCPHRQSLGGACYVNLGQAPLSIYRAYKRGTYALEMPNDALNGRYLRLGAYGDPAALPESVVASLVAASSGHTGYTHQWKAKRFQWALEYMQASVDSLGDLEKLHKIKPNAGYFRVTSGDTMLDNELQCPSDTHGVQCVDCRKCDGTKGAAIVIGVHGSLASRFVEPTDIIAVA